MRREAPDSVAGGGVATAASPFATARGIVRLLGLASAVLLLPPNAAGQEGDARVPASDTLGDLGGSSPAAHPDSRPGSGPEARLHALVNARREAVGCPPLAWHAPAARVAEDRSADMIAHRYFDHRTPDGRTVFDELAAARIRAAGDIAENLALTPAGPASALEMWRDSPEHRRNLDRCSFTHHGLGERDGVWTQILLANPVTAKSAADSGPTVSPAPDPSSPRP